MRSVLVENVATIVFMFLTFTVGRRDAGMIFDQHGSSINTTTEVVMDYSYYALVTATVLPSSFNRCFPWNGQLRRVQSIIGRLGDGRLRDSLA